MVDFIIDVSNVCWGIVDTTEKNHITIAKSEWAPGIWAGKKNGYIELKSPTGEPKGIYLIINVDMENRRIEINNVGGFIIPGDLIYPKVK